MKTNESKPKVDRLISPEEAAQYTGVCKATILAAIAARKLPALRLSKRCFRIRLEDLLPSI